MASRRDFCQVERLFHDGEHPTYWESFPNICPLPQLVGGWTNPFEKYARQIGSFPQGGVEIKKNVWNHHLDKVLGLLQTKGWAGFHIHFTYSFTTIYYKASLEKEGLSHNNWRIPTKKQAQIWWLKEPSEKRRKQSKIWLHSPIHSIHVWYMYLHLVDFSTQCK